MREPTTTRGHGSGSPLAAETDPGRDQRAAGSVSTRSPLRADADADADAETGAEEPGGAVGPAGSGRQVASTGAGSPSFVESLPDLIDASEYADHPDGRLVRLRITVTGSGVEILGDAFRPAVLEALLADLGGGATEQMLCGY